MGKGVSEMLAVMSSHEVAEWIAYFKAMQIKDEKQKEPSQDDMKAKLLSSFGNSVGLKVKK